MAKEFFKDLPDTTTPITAGRLNGLLDGEEPMGDLVVDSIRTKNMFDKNSVLMGYEINGSDGTVSTNNSYYVSDYIPVKPNTNYYLTKTNNGTSNCFYDINKNFISTIRKDQGVITTPDNSNVYYMRFNGPQSDLDNVQVEEGSVATEYKPYQQLESNDTGWINMTLETGFTNYNTSDVSQYRKRNGVVFLQGSVRNTSQIPSNRTTVFSTLPEGYRPTKEFFTVCQGSGMNKWLFKIETNGQCVIERYGTTSNSEIPQGTWLPFCCSFITN